MKKRELKVIGRREVIDIPDLGLMGIDAKIDTGAYSSAIHCHDIRLVKTDDRKYVEFYLLDPTHPDYNDKKITLPVLKERRIKNSFGKSQKRFIIKTNMILHGETISVECSLADRSNLEYPILLGRKVCKNRFLVDVSRVNLSLKAKQKKD